MKKLCLLVIILIHIINLGTCADSLENISLQENQPLQMASISKIMQEAEIFKSAGYLYPIVDTGQKICFDSSNPINNPKPGEPYYGQDAQFTKNTPAYTISNDGLTVQDMNTGLIWQRSPDTNGDLSVSASDKLTWNNAREYPAKLNAEKFGGFSDWRLPTIKELYSLIIFSGTDPDPSSGSDTKLIPFIDSTVFSFAYGQIHAGERIIDSQYASNTIYTGKMSSGDKLFGVNFADGRIKGYNTVLPDGSEKTFYVLCVRGNPEYGKNNFVANTDGTISDKATGLMWSSSDSTYGMNWIDAFSWVQEKNADNYLGYNDWRLPNAKELQSIVDYLNL